MLTVVADNDLLNSNVRSGDRLGIGASEVLEVATAVDKQRFLELARTTSSAAKAALLWRDERFRLPGRHDRRYDRFRASGVGCP